MLPMKKKKNLNFYLVVLCRVSWKDHHNRNWIFVNKCPKVHDCSSQGQLGGNILVSLLVSLGQGESRLHQTDEFEHQ